MPPAAPIARLFGKGAAPDPPHDAAPGHAAPRVLTFDGTDQYAAMVDAFAAGVASGNRLPDPAEDGLAQMRGLVAILAAAKRA